MADDLNIYAEIDQRIELIEELVRGGRTALAGTLRRLAEFRSLVHEFSEGETFGWALLEIVDPLIEIAGAGPVAAPIEPEEFDRRARLLAADALEIGFDEDGHFEFHDINKLKHDARRLLTGVDEGPYERHEDDEPRTS